MYTCREASISIAIGAIALFHGAGCEDPSADLMTIGGSGPLVPGLPAFDEAAERGGPSPDGAPWRDFPAPATEANRMTWGVCFAGSKLEDESALGGFGPCDNFPKPIESRAAKESGRCYLLAEPNVVVDGPYVPGMRLTLVNGTGRAAAFDAADSRLYILQEALDENGAWRPIETFPEIWCGNSCHRVLLGPGEYWEFATPRYGGDFETKLRFRLTDADGTTLLLSNEFDGSIHQEQFALPTVDESI